MISFILNEREYTSKLPPGAVTLDLLRKEAGLTGTKEGCREGDCGACTVLLGIPLHHGMKYMALNSCLLPVGELQGRHLVTIEGVNPGEGFSFIQTVFVDEGASQCGFCTPGNIMSLTGYLLSTVNPEAAAAADSLGGNICRCTGYVSIRKAAETVSCKISHSPADSCFTHEHIEWLVANDILPPYFLSIEERLHQMDTGESSEPEYSSEPAFTVAGGTDLFATEAENLRNAGIRFLLRNSEFNKISVKDNRTIIGAGATVTDIINAGVFENTGNLHQSLKLISSSQVRNRATAGGNIVNASPIGDLTIIFLALNAKVKIKDGSGLREARLKEFFKGYKELDLSPGELVESLEFLSPDAATRVNFEKVSMRKHLDIATVNTAAALRVSRGKFVKADFSAGGVAPIPLYLEKTSDSLIGQRVSTETARMAVRIARSEVSPIDDVRGSAEYKKLLLGRLIAAHFVQLFPELIAGKELL